MEKEVSDTLLTHISTIIHETWFSSALHKETGVTMGFWYTPKSPVKYYAVLNFPNFYSPDVAMNHLNHIFRAVIQKKEVTHLKITGKLERMLDSTRCIIPFLITSSLPEEDVRSALCSADQLVYEPVPNTWNIRDGSVASSPCIQLADICKRAPKQFRMLPKSAPSPNEGVNKMPDTPVNMRARLSGRNANTSGCTPPSFSAAVKAKTKSKTLITEVAQTAATTSPSNIDHPKSVHARVGTPNDASGAVPFATPATKSRKRMKRRGKKQTAVTATAFPLQLDEASETQLVDGSPRKEDGSPLPTARQSLPKVDNNPTRREVNPFSALAVDVASDDVDIAKDTVMDQSTVTHPDTDKKDLDKRPCTPVVAGPPLAEKALRTPSPSQNSVLTESPAADLESSPFCPLDNDERTSSTTIPSPLIADIHKEVSLSPKEDDVAPISKKNTANSSGCSFTPSVERRVSTRSQKKAAASQETETRAQPDRVNKAPLSIPKAASVPLTPRRTVEESPPPVTDPDFPALSEASITPSDKKERRRGRNSYSPAGL
jgi:hypothetical protein